MSKLNQIESNGTTYDVEDSGAVRFDAAQNLTAAQKTTARSNIGAVADNQGAANAGKALVVSQNGSITVGDAGIPDSVKAALLQCFSKTAWIDGNGQDYYDALVAALSGGTPQITLPDLSIGEWERGYYWNEDGTEASSNYTIISRTYYEVEPLREYTWIQGFSSYMQSGSTMTGAMNRYKICMYDDRKNLIGYTSNDDIFTTDITVVEPKSFSFTTLQNTKYIRVSCLRWPVGFFADNIPTNIYSVIIVFGKTNDTEFASSDMPDIESAIRVYRGNNDITLYAKTGCTTVQSIDTETYQYGRGEFSINTGASAEGGPATYTKTRYILVKNLLLESGDVITINKLKVAIWAQKLTGGTVQHTTSWLTAGGSFTIGE